jgi:hypothetical protein
LIIDGTGAETACDDDVDVDALAIGEMDFEEKGDADRAGTI